MSVKTGDTARLIQPVVQGTVIKIKFDEDTGEKRALLAWTDADGTAQERWFPADALEAST